MQEQLEKEVEEYNKLVESITKVRQELEAAEQDRLQRLGRIQVLSELIQKEADQGTQETNGQVEEIEPSKVVRARKSPRSAS